MAAPFTFGSLRDILAICQMGISLGKAVSDKRGSTKDYQEFRNEIDSLVQVAATYEAGEVSPSMAESARIAKLIVDECGIIMGKELSRLHEKYHESFQPGGSGSQSRDTYKKMKFGVMERDKLQETREKLRTRTCRLSTLVTITAQRAHQTNAASIIARLKDIQDSVEKSMQHRQDQLEMQTKPSADTCRHMAHRRILDRLEFNDMSTRFDEIATAYMHTFEWILDDRFHYRGEISFKNWLSSGSGIFHISGKPGSGKSTLMKFLCNSSRTQEGLTTWAGGKLLVFASFFFWKSGRVIQKSQGGLLRSLLHQCLSNCPELIPRVFPKPWKEAELLDWRTSAPIKISNDAVYAAFNELMQNEDIHANYRFCFFIDGLDEYEESQKDFQDLVIFLRQWTEWVPQDLKICVSSREMNAFELGFSPAKRYRLQDLTRNDIAHFIRGRLQLQQFGIAHDEERLNELVESILFKAQGVFLWVTLVLRTVRESLLNGDSLEMIQKKIDRLPHELEQLFQSIIDSINVEDLRVAAQTLEIVAFPDRIADSVNGFPWFYNLSWYYYLDMYNEDLSFAMGMKLMSPGIDKAGFMRQQNEARRRLYGRCKGLVEVFTAKEQFPGYDQYMRVTHRSIFEFLTTPGIRQKIGVHAEHFDVSNQVGQSFLAQIKSLDLQKLLSGADKKRLYMFLSAGIHTILTYAHATCAGSKNHNELLDDMEEVLRQRLGRAYSDFFSHHANLIALASNDSRLLVRPIIQGYELSMCHLAAYHGLCQYVVEKMKRNKASSTGSSGISLLHCAIYGAYHIQSTAGLETVRAILELGISPNALLFTSSSHGSESPVSVWVFFFNYAIGSLCESMTQRLIDLLLEFGADADVRFGVDTSEHVGDGSEEVGSLWVEYQIIERTGYSEVPAYARWYLGESLLVEEPSYYQYSHPRDFWFSFPLSEFLGKRGDKGVHLKDLLNRSDI